MDLIIQGISDLYFQWKNNVPERIEKLPQSGSDRIYFRIFNANETYIATYNLNVQENNTFVIFSQHFVELGLPVPAVYCYK
ncbi:MAG: hypothetical protein V9E96_06740 [Chitinophagaceae bacterium]